MIEHNMNAPLGPSSRTVAKEGTKGAPHWDGGEGRGAHSCAHSEPNTAPVFLMTKLTPWLE